MKHKFTVKNNHFGTYPVGFHHNGRPSLGAAMKKCTPDNYNGYHFKAAVMEACCMDDQLFKARKEEKFIQKFNSRDITRDWDYPNRHYPAPTAAGISSNKLNKFVHMFTITNQKEHGSAVRQMRHFGMDVQVLGRNLQHYDHDVKIPLLIKHIPTIETDFTMFFDSDDIWFASDLEHLFKTFEKNKDCKMLCNADAWFFPGNNSDQSQDIQSWMKQTIANEGVRTPYEYLNSGLWVARTEFLQNEFLPRLKVLRAAQDLNMSIQTYSDCDQSLFHFIYRDLYPAMKIDSTCMYFQPWNWSPWLEENFTNCNSLTITKK